MGMSKPSEPHVSESVFPLLLRVSRVMRSKSSGAQYWLPAHGTLVRCSGVNDVVAHEQAKSAVKQYEKSKNLFMAPTPCVAWKR